MKKLMAFLIVFCMLTANMAVGTINIRATDESVSIFMAGASTVQGYGPERAPLAGWAQFLDEYLPPKVNVKNFAQSGRSSKSFVDEGRLDAIMREIQEGDYLAIHFAHNDQKSDDPNRYTEPSTTYKEYLKQYIERSRQKGAIPILVTAVERRTFSGGRHVPSLGEYPQAMRELALEEGVALVDLTEISERLYNHLGDEGSKKLFLILQPGESPNYPNGITDNTHLSEYGAREVGKIFLSELSKTNLPISEDIGDIETIKIPEPPKEEEKKEEQKETPLPQTPDTQEYFHIYEQTMEDLALQNIFTGYENGDMNINGSLTRAEFTAIMTRTLSLKGKGNAPTFSDVAADHWAADSISAAYENNILSGYGDGRFGPEDMVTYEQVARVLVEVMGYTKEANERAAYPWGILLEASYNGLAAFVNADVGRALTRGQAAQMLYNAFYTPMAGGSVLADKIVGKTYFVSLDGSDNNDGSYSNPWKTIKKAASTLKAGETAIITEGRYNEEGTVHFANGGDAKAPITLRAIRRGEVEITYDGDSFIEIPKGSSNVVIKKLSISSSSEGGRLISSFGDNTVISDNTLTMAGGSAIFSKSNSGAIIEENNVNSADIVMENVANAIIRQNKVSEGNDRAVTISGESKNIQIHSNHIQSQDNELEAGISLSGQNSVFWNNVIVSHYGGLIGSGVEYKDTKDCHGYNNIIIGSVNGISFNGENTAPVLKNNIFTDCTSDAYSFEQTPQQLVSDYNVYHNTYPFKLEKNSKYNDPGFVDKYNDWHVKQGSPAIGGGAVIPSIFTGADGETMVLDMRDFAKETWGTKWNMGVYNATSDLFISEEEYIAQRPGSAILSETFENPSSDWVIGTGKWEIKSGMCIQTDEAMGRSVIRYAPGNDWTNYEVSASVKSPPDRRESTAGIIFRADENLQNMYVFRLYENAQLELAKWDNGRFVSIEKWDYNILPDRVYNLKIQAAGNKIIMFVDGVAVKEVTDDSYSSGTIGLYSFKQIGEFDNVRVVRIEN